MNNVKFNYIEASFLIVIVMITHIITDLPNTIIEDCSTASILNTLFIFIIVIIYFFIIYKLFTPFENGSILNVSEFVGGKGFKKFISLIYIFYLIFVAGLLLRDFAETLNLIYFPNAQTFTIILSFILVALFSNIKDSTSIIKLNTLIVPQILVSIIIVFISSIYNFNYNSIFPLFGNGIKHTFLSGSKNIYAFAGLSYIYLIRPNLKNSNDFKKVGIISIIISGLYLLFSVSSILMLFPYQIAGKETLSMYLSTRTVEFGRFLQRSDAFFMFIWIFTFLSYLSVIIFYLKKLSKDGLGLVNKKSPQLYIFSLLIFIVALIPQNYNQIDFLKHYVYKYLSLFIIYGFCFLILIIGYFKKKRSLK